MKLLALAETKKYMLEVHRCYQEEGYQLESKDYIRMLKILGDVYNYLEEK